MQLKNKKQRTYTTRARSEREKTTETTQKKQSAHTQEHAYMQAQKKKRVHIKKTHINEPAVENVQIPPRN